MTVPGRGASITVGARSGCRGLWSRPSGWPRATDVGTGVTAYLGAHTVVEFLGQICDQPGWVARREARGA